MSIFNVVGFFLLYVHRRRRRLFVPSFITFVVFWLGFYFTLALPSLLLPSSFLCKKEIYFVYKQTNQTVSLVSRQRAIQT